MSSGFGGHNLVRNKMTEASGISCVLKNIEGVTSLCEMLKTSYGVDGMYKLVVNAHKKTVISRSVSSILSGCDIEHPALKMLVEPIVHLSMMGDCTGFLIGVIGEVLRRSAALIQQGVPPTEIADGLRECLGEIEEVVNGEGEEVQFTLEDKKVLQRILSGIAKEKKLAELLGESIVSVSENGALKIDNVRVAKVNVGSLEDSERFQGMLLEACPEGVARRGENVKVAVYACPLSITNMDTKGTVLLRSAEELLAFRKEDENTVRKQVDEITSNGVGMIVCSGSVDALMMDYLNEKNVCVVTVGSKYDIRRLCVLFGARFSNSVRKTEKESLGECTSFEMCEYGEKRYMKVRGNGKIDTIILRGSLPPKLEESERVIGKAIYALKVCAEEAYSNKNAVRLLRGAGACEKEISRKMKERAERHTDVRQIAMKVFADAIRTVGERCAPMKTGGREEAEEVMDIAAIKKRALEYALVLSSDILGISQMFITKNEDAVQAPKRQGHWDDRED